MSGADQSEEYQFGGGAASRSRKNTCETITTEEATSSAVDEQDAGVSDGDDNGESEQDAGSKEGDEDAITISAQEVRVCII